MSTLVDTSVAVRATLPIHTSVTKTNQQKQQHFLKGELWLAVLFYGLSYEPAVAATSRPPLVTVSLQTLVMMKSSAVRVLPSSLLL